MNIAIDFDDTFTADPDLWRSFIEDALNRGHLVYIVTCRMDNDENRAEVHGDCGPQIGDSPITGLPRHRHYFTSMSPKRWFMLQRGVVIDIWIDDIPDCVENGR